MILHRRGWRIGAAAGVGVVGLVCAAIAWATLLTPQPVVTAKGRQFLGGAAPASAFIAYGQSRRGHPDQFDAYVKPSGLPRYKVNQRGQGFGGGIDGSTLIWQSVRRGQSDLRLFDLSTHARSVPTGVNTRRYEWGLTISGNWILYGQTWWHGPYLNSRAILHNETTAETRVLGERIDRAYQEAKPGQVNGDYASWMTVNYRTGASNAFLYQISTSTQTRIPEPVGKVQYDPSVAAAGNVFYVRSEPKPCGNHVVLREYSAGTDTLLARLPQGYDVYLTYAVDEGGGVTTVYFGRYKCGGTRLTSDIYKITVS